jgi:hypothetical protein
MIDSPFPLFHGPKKKKKNKRAVFYMLAQPKKAFHPNFVSSILSALRGAILGLGASNPLATWEIATELNGES